MAFSFRVGTNWCHDFPKVARESGFHFNMHRAGVRVDWNRIGSIDIDRVIGERDFSTIDENVNNIVDCCLESEYDVKILEPNFVKLFRLAQLAVEYLLYCKQYLDQSVMILKDELRSKLEENVKLKKEFDICEETIRESRDSKFKERRRIIEKQCNDSHGEIHKCPQCPKTFVSAIFLNAHVNRRHPQVYLQTCLDSSTVHKKYLAEAEKLHEEIKTLKERLNQTERVIRNESEKFSDTEGFCALKNGINPEKGSGECRHLGEGRKTRDKDEEQYRRYQQEIRYFKAMLLSEIRNDKIVDASRWGKEETDCSGEDVKDLIRRQEKEIERLRDQLQRRLTPDIEGIHAKLENQEDFWQSKIDNLETRHRIDIEKLYSQLQVSRESVNEMRLDYMTKINDLEWKSRSESVIPDRKNLIERSSSPATRDENGGESSKEVSPSIGIDSMKNNYLVRGKRHRQDDEKIRGESMKKSENVCEYADNESHGKMIRPLLSLPSKDSRAIESLDKATLMPINKDRNKRINRLEGFKSNANLSLRRESQENRLSNIQKSNAREIEKQEMSSLDSGDCTTATSTTTTSRDAERENAVQVFDRKSEALLSKIQEKKQRFLVSSRINGLSIFRDSREKLSSEKHNDAEVDKSRKFSSEESLENSESTEESQTEDSDDGRVSVNSNDKKMSNFRTEENSNQDSIEQRLHSKLRELGIDPEWQAIPNGTFAQVMETIGHERNLNSKKYRKFDEIRSKIIQQVSQTLLTDEKLAIIDYSPKRSTLEKLVTNVKSKASRALKILEKNEGSRRSVNAARAEKVASNKIKKLRGAGHRISEENTYEAFSSCPLSKKTIGNNNSVDSTGDLKHSYESIKDFVKDANRKIVTSTPQRNERKLILHSAFTNDPSIIPNANHRDSILSLSGSPRNNSKGVLKSTSVLSGSHVKKKVLFDLQSETSPERDEKKYPMESERNNQPKKNPLSSLLDISREETDRDIGQSPQSGSIVLKTRQSEKIAQISKQIEKQLSIPREKPVGAVEAIFMDKFSLRRDNDEPRVNAYSSFRSPPTEQLETKTSTDNNLPQAAPRVSHYITSKSKDLNLDMDIDELLEIQ